MAVESKVDLSPDFVERIEPLARTSRPLGQAATGEASRTYQQPTDTPWNGDPRDIAGLVEAFNRDELNDDSARAIADPSSPGTTGDLIWAKAPIDYLAIRERGFRAGLASPVRGLVHAAARRLGQGNDAGVLRNGLIGYLQDLKTSSAP
jgi:hypothetical protein